MRTVHKHDRGVSRRASAGEPGVRTHCFRSLFAGDAVVVAVELVRVGRIGIEDRLLLGLGNVGRQLMSTNAVVGVTDVGGGAVVGMVVLGGGGAPVTQVRSDAVDCVGRPAEVLKLASTVGVSAGLPAGPATQVAAGAAKPEAVIARFAKTPSTPGLVAVTA